MNSSPYKSSTEQKKYSYIVRVLVLFVVVVIVSSLAIFAASSNSSYGNYYLGDNDYYEYEFDWEDYSNIYNTYGYIPITPRTPPGVPAGYFLMRYRVDGALFPLSNPYSSQFIGALPPGGVISASIPIRPGYTLMSFAGQFTWHAMFTDIVHAHDASDPHIVSRFTRTRYRGEYDTVYYGSFILSQVPFFPSERNTGAYLVASFSSLDLHYYDRDLNYNASDVHRRAIVGFNPNDFSLYARIRNMRAGANSHVAPLRLQLPDLQPQNVLENINVTYNFFNFGTDIYRRRTAQILPGHATDENIGISYDIPIFPSNEIRYYAGSFFSYIYVYQDVFPDSHLNPTYAGRTWGGMDRGQYFEVVFFVERPATSVVIQNPRDTANRNANISFDHKIGTASNPANTLQYPTSTSPNATFVSTEYVNPADPRPSRLRDIVVTLSLPCRYSFFAYDEFGNAAYFNTTTQQADGALPITPPPGYEIISAIVDDGYLIVVLRPRTWSFEFYKTCIAIENDPFNPLTDRNPLPGAVFQLWWDLGSGWELAYTTQPSNSEGLVVIGDAIDIALPQPPAYSSVVRLKLVELTPPTGPLAFELPVGHWYIYFDMYTWSVRDINPFVNSNSGDPVFVQRLVSYEYKWHVGNRLTGRTRFSFIKTCDNGTVLPGAEFTLARWDPTADGGSGDWVIVPTTEQPNGNPQDSNSSGRVTFYLTQNGQYMLKETAVPSAEFILPPGHWLIVRDPVTREVYELQPSDPEAPNFYWLPVGGASGASASIRTLHQCDECYRCDPSLGDSSPTIYALQPRSVITLPVATTPQEIADRIDSATAIGTTFIIPIQFSNNIAATGLGEDFPPIIMPVITGNRTIVLDSYNGVNQVWNRNQLAATGGLVQDNLDNSRHFIVQSGATLELRNVTLSRCADWVEGNPNVISGGVSVRGNGSIFRMTHTNATISNNRGFGGLTNGSSNAARMGGGVNVFSRGRFEMTAGNIINNVSGYGGGIFVDNFGGAVQNNTYAVITGGRISGNRATAGAGIGTCCRAHITLGDNVQIYDNIASSDGGGVALGYFGGNQLIINGGVIRSNIANRHGGGVFTDEEPPEYYSTITPNMVTMTDGLIYNNTANQDGGGVFIGRPGNNAISHSFTLMGGTIGNNNPAFGNRANRGGGVFLGGDATQGSASFTISATNAANSMILGNSATTHGGGIFAEAVNTSVNLNGGLIALNTANAGGGLFTQHDGEQAIPWINIASAVVFSHNHARDGMEVNHDMPDLNNQINPGTVSVIPTGHAFTNFDINADGVAYEWFVANARSASPFEFIKTDAALYQAPVGTHINPLNNAVFRLERYVSAGSTWTQTGTATSGNCGTAGRVVFTTLLTVSARYRLTETAAPANYVLPSGHWYIYTNDTGNISSIVPSGNVRQFITVNNSTIPLHVGNDRIPVFHFHKTDQSMSADEDGYFLPGAQFMLFRFTGTGTPPLNILTNADLDQSVANPTWLQIQGPGGAPDYQFTSSNVTPMHFAMMPGHYYQLIEIMSPVGFLIPQGQWRLVPTGNVITASSMLDFNVTVHNISIGTAMPNIARTAPANGHHFYIGNIPDFSLPLTGGMGSARHTLIFGTAGLLMLSGAAIIIMRQKAKKKAMAMYNASVTPSTYTPPTFRRLR